MGRTRRLTMCAMVLSALAGASSSASALSAFRSVSGAGLPPRSAGTFAPRIGSALGIVPARNRRPSPLPPVIPVVYHGGSVMRGVTLHTIFWAPAGYRFSPAPSASVPSYAALVQQFAGDLAAASGSGDNVFSTLAQYGDGAGPGSYSISYDRARDSISDADPYPSSGRTCNSPAGIVTCVSDRQLQRELGRVIRSRGPAAVGLHDLWLIFLPPDVDTCVSAGSCATNAYAGYHSLTSAGPNPVVYAVMPSPLVELTPPAGSDPQGNPEAETSLDTMAHEVVEAITDPEGTGWMDPNGFETGDKCEAGPQYGSPLGYALDGAPYDQLIGGHQYLLQSMWSNRDSGCRQSSIVAAAGALPRVALMQYSATLTGDSGVGQALPVEAALARAGKLVGLGVGRTDARGHWRLTLRGPDGTSAAVGDDRDEVLIRYGNGGPPPELIQTGDGGNPFTAAGWTGWFDLTHGVAAGRHSVLVAPCSQVGGLTLRIDGRPAGSPVLACSTSSDSARVQTEPLRSSARLLLSSEDNRAPTIDAPYGALVTLTVALGEPGAVPAVTNGQLPFANGGIAACTADLRRQRVSCTGLVAGARYTLVRRRGGTRLQARANRAGTASFRPLPGSGRGLSGGDLLTLRSAVAGQVTVLHVAHLRVDLAGSSSLISGGRCEPGNYVGEAISAPPLGTGIGQPGVAGTGTICPLDGAAAGLAADTLLQQDDRGPGQTETEVPSIAGTAPAHDAILYGPFVALAQAALPTTNGSTLPTHDRIAVAITRAGGRDAVFRAANVDTASGVRVAQLPRGTYTATWTLIDAAGDTRTLRTQFIEER